MSAFVRRSVEPIVNFGIISLANASRRIFIPSYLSRPWTYKDSLATDPRFHECHGSFSICLRGRGSSTRAAAYLPLRGTSVRKPVASLDLRFRNRSVPRVQSPNEFRDPMRPPISRTRRVLYLSSPSHLSFHLRNIAHRPAV